MNACRAIGWLLLAGFLAGCAPQFQSAGMASAVPELRTDAIVTADGARLPLRVWAPHGRPRAVLLALHGMNDYSNAFAIPGEAWRKEGVVTYAYDQRGFGATARPGIWAGAATLAGDFLQAAALLRRRHPDLPLYALGTSMGGGVILSALASRTEPVVDGVILAAPAVWGRETLPPGTGLALWLAARIVPSMTLSGRGLNRVASDNRPLLRTMARDPLVLKEARVDALYGLVDLMDAAYAAAAEVSAPVLLLYGGNDQIVPRRPVENVARRLPQPRLAFYEHGFHMLLRDLNGDVVHRDVAAWIADPNAALPSGADTRARALLSNAAIPAVARP
jgi:alpha-beta hydrolase superfamily lysophospholipase